MSACVLIGDLEAVSQHPLQYVKSLAHGESQLAGAILTAI